MNSFDEETQARGETADALRERDAARAERDELLLQLNVSAQGGIRIVTSGTIISGDARRGRHAPTWREV